MNNDATMTKAQVLALTAAMLSTAHVDGVQPAELALIERFYAEAGVVGLPPFSEAIQASEQGRTFIHEAAADRDFAEQLVLMCLMTGYADGQFSDRERVHVAGIAGEAGLSDAQVEQLHRQVKDALIGSLAHLPDSESIAALAKTL
jgi:hypothetical protein